MKEKGIIFGTFDGLHDGHRFFINNAKKHAEQLVIIVATDKSVLHIKGHLPRFPLSERIAELKKEVPEARVLSGDEEENSWQILKDEQPDIVLCGYDQDALLKELSKIRTAYGFELIQITEDYNGKEIHSSLIEKE